MASSPFHKRPIALAPLNGVRVLACTGITLFHVALLFVAAGSAWHWYDILDRHKWANLACGAAFMFAMTTFMILTGLLAASRIIPGLEQGQDQWRKVIWSYYARRIWRILPAYYVALAINACAWSWPAAWSSPSPEAEALQDYFKMGNSRAAWTLPLLISNITLDMRSFIFCWNIPVQLQFYLLLPLIGLLLQPQSPSFRRRIAWTCVLAAVVATLYRIVIVMAFSIQAQLPIGAHSHAASHHPSSVVAAWGFLDWLYSAFISRMTDLALGILIYIIIASPRACAAIRSRPWVCTIVSALVSAFVVSTCLADSDIRPRPEEVAPLSARLGVQVVAFGVVVPVTLAWLVLYVLVQPGWPARRAAEILGSPKTLYHKNYSPYTTHTVNTSKPPVTEIRGA
ncbi:hypothetical protein WJX84_002961 [Apatococcus fuscideae]|uniref:Acyltransferase 3 domain-containing protein n=1 Tax=Apatococcus fuscideae TaxID=2026836 RepID=A0AAW1TAW3_9CHLO